MVLPEKNTNIRDFRGTSQAPEAMSVFKNFAEWGTALVEGHQGVFHF